jgi:hypothetical protein
LPPAAASKPKKPPATFDDFAEGFDGKFKTDDYHQSVDDYLGETPGSLRLKGVKSAVSLTSDNLARRAPQPHGQAFGNRYDFGASLSAAIQAANSALGERSGLMMKSSAPRKQSKYISDAEQTASPLTMSSNHSMNRATSKPAPAPVQHTSGTDSPRPAGSEKPVLASQSYNELLDKYCFVRTHEHHRTTLDS